MKMEMKNKFSTVCVLLVLTHKIKISMLGAMVVADTESSSETCNSSIVVHGERNFTIGTNTAPRYGIVTAVFVHGDGNETLVLGTSPRFYLEQMNDLTWIVRLSVCLNAGDTATLELTLISDEDEVCDNVRLSVTVVPTTPLFSLFQNSGRPPFVSFIRSCDPTAVIEVASVMNVFWCITFACSVRCSNDEKRFWPKEDEPSKIMTDGRGITEGKHYELEATCTETNIALQTEVNIAVRFLSVKFIILVTCETPPTTETPRVYSEVSLATVHMIPAKTFTPISVSGNPPRTGIPSIVTNAGGVSAFTPQQLRTVDRANVEHSTQDSLVAASRKSKSSVSFTAAFTTSTQTTQMSTPAIPKTTLEGTTLMTLHTSVANTSVHGLFQSRSTVSYGSSVNTVSINSGLQTHDKTSWNSTAIDSMNTIPPASSVPKAYITTNLPIQTTTLDSASTSWTTKLLNTSTHVSTPVYSNGMAQGVTTGFMNKPFNVAAVATIGVLVGGVGITLAARKLFSTMPSASRSSQEG